MERVSDAAIGEGETEMHCYNEKCVGNLKLKFVQKAIGTPTFSNWVRKIQSAVVETARVVGLESFLFCPYAIIMESKPEDNKNVPFPARRLRQGY